MSIYLDVEIKGTEPLLMNRFIDESGMVKEKNLSPLEMAKKKCYEDKEGLYYPTDNIYSCLIEAGKFHKHGKVKVTTARSSLIPAGLKISGDRIYFKTPKTWEIDSRAVVNPATGGRMMCHRPMLKGWELEFTLILDTTMFSSKFIKELLHDAGSKVGLGDYRPQRKGKYGTFIVVNWKEHQ
jgi:hypothetical protein